jgi:beta-glucosidase
VTFYTSVGDLPPFTDYAMKGRSYRYFGGRPEYPFGYGLSYTNFRYSAPTVSRSGTARMVTVRVSNSGQRSGDEVVQLYVTPPSGGGVPLRSLKSFERIRLAPGETRNVSFHLTPRDLAFADSTGTMRTRKGGYSLWIGGGQPDTGSPGVAAQIKLAASTAVAP